MQTLHCEPIVYFFGGPTLNLKKLEIERLELNLLWF
jgi:hypothetical protein